MYAFIFSCLTFVNWASAKPILLPSAPIKESRDCILNLVSQKMNIPLNDAILRPKVRPENDITLKEFQDSIEEFWKFRPDAITNVYNPLRNEIFIMTEKSYYKKFNRSVFDSLAHELTHYIQKEYQHADFTVGDDSLEMQAIEIQTWFRETYQSQFQNDHFICP